MSKQHLVVGLGELLWDMLPGGKQLGGAPSNFSVMSARLGNHAVVASRIGRDDLGKESMTILAGTPVDPAYIQVDSDHPTGSVSVTLCDGQPEYVIHEPVAWDFFNFDQHWKMLAERADAVCFGTLAQRASHSRGTMKAFLESTRSDCVRVLDVNLRKPFFSAEILSHSLAYATLLKLNDAEMPTVLGLLNLSNNMRTEEDALFEGARLLLKYSPLELVCITMGSHGSLLVSRSGHHRHTGVPIQVADTVGAGDAFTAALVHYYLQGASLPTLNEAGNRWGSWVASQKGAMPPLSDTVRARITEQIESTAAL